MGKNAFYWPAERSFHLLFSSEVKTGQRNLEYWRKSRANVAFSRMSTYYWKRRIFGSYNEAEEPLLSRKSSVERGKNGHTKLEETSSTSQMHQYGDLKNGSLPNTGPKAGLMPRPIGGCEKLGTFSGVFVPTSLNVLSILMFLRFGFILGQSGVIGMMGESHRPHQIIRF